MTACIVLTGPDEGRVYIECDGCGKRHTIRAYSTTKTRTHAAAHLGWVRTGDPGNRRDWCPDCEPEFELETPA